MLPPGQIDAFTRNGHIPAAQVNLQRADPQQARGGRNSRAWQGRPQQQLAFFDQQADGRQVQQWILRPVQVLECQGKLFGQVVDAQNAGCLPESTISDRKTGSDNTLNHAATVNSGSNRFNPPYPLATHLDWSCKRCKADLGQS